MHSQTDISRVNNCSMTIKVVEAVGFVFDNNFCFKSQKLKQTRAGEGNVFLVPVNTVQKWFIGWFVLVNWAP